MTASVTTSTTNFNKTLVELIDKRLEELLRAPLPHIAPANYRPAQFVKGTNNTLRYINVPDLSVITGTPTPGQSPWLTEGTTPDVEDLTIGYEEFSAYQAGRILRFTDKALLQSPFDLLSVGADRVARNAIVTADKYVADKLVLGTNVIYGGTATATGQIVAADVMTGALIKRAVALLKGTNVPTFPDGTYHAIQHPFVTLDLESDDDVGGWIDASRYAGAQALLTGELGRYAGVRFQESSHAAVLSGDGSGSIDVYSTIIFGPEAYAFGDWQQISTHMTPPGGGSDPLFQRALLGWKGWFGAVVMGEGTNATNVTPPRYVRIETASSI